MRRSRLLATSVVVSVFALGVVPTAEAVDYFLEVDGVQGESQDAQQAGSIDVLSFSWGAVNAGNRARRTELKELQIGKNVDSASPPLFQRLAQATQIPSVELIGRRPGERSQVFLRYCFQNVQVTSIEVGDSRGSSGGAPSESVNFSYAAVSEQYSQQRPDGSLGATVFAGWNSTTGQLIASYPSPCGGT